jgi:hypothetical protein
LRLLLDWFLFWALMVETNIKPRIKVAGKNIVRM